MLTFVTDEGAAEDDTLDEDLESCLAAPPTLTRLPPPPEERWCTGVTTYLSLRIFALVPMFSPMLFPNQFFSLHRLLDRSHLTSGFSRPLFSAN